MRHSKLVLISLSLCVILLGIVILGQVSENVKEFESVAIELQPPEEEPPEEIEEIEEALRFDLKYDKYLVPEPYEYEVDGQLRVFQFEKMIDAFKKADEEFAKGEITYVDNYKNQNGYAPYYHGKSVDAAGARRSSSAPGYMDISDRNEFIYIPDGTLVRVLEEEPDFTRVVLVESGKEYFVPSKYVRTEYYLTALNKAIAVDRNNQNIAVFEKRPEGWTVVSYSLATTGTTGKYHQPTPLGYFYAIEKRERFYYLKDGTNEIEGYAPYAVRFTAGAYIHGIATAYKYREDGTRIDSGIQEFSSTIGTVPLSHKCVRNYTSHAKFIYDWYVHGETIVVVIE